jgi:hypothetical protein
MGAIAMAVNIQSEAISFKQVRKADSTITPNQLSDPLDISIYKAASLQYPMS